MSEYEGKLFTRAQVSRVARAHEDGRAQGAAEERARCLGIVQYHIEACRHMLRGDADDWLEMVREKITHSGNSPVSGGNSGTEDA